MVTRLLPVWFQRLLIGDAAGRYLAAMQRSNAGDHPHLHYRKLFIVGSPRSGTTWVNSIFAKHPQVVSNGESQLYPSVMRYLKKGNCRDPRTWDKILTHFDEREAADPRAGVHVFVNRRTFRQILHAARRQVKRNESWTELDAGHFVIRAVLDHYFLRKSRSPNDLLVEKTPAHVMFGRDILNAFPEGQLLHVLRDGRDVCVSLQMRSQTAAWAPRERRQQIKTWMRFVKHGLQIMDDDEFAGRTMQIRYETLKHDPIQAIGELYDFAGLSHSPRLLARVAEKTSFERHRRTGPTLHNRKGIVGDWKNHFTAEDMKLFKSKAGSLFENCGYRFG